MPVDVLLAFPPQWSPFQPALSLPSLAAWTRRAGYSVDCLDLNLDFYDWLLSDECAAFLIGEVRRSPMDAKERLGYEALFGSADRFRSLIRRHLTPGVREPRPGGPDQELVASQYTAVRTFQTYLGAVTRVCDDVVVSPYEFRLERGNLDSAELDLVVKDPPPLLAEYIRHAAMRLAEHPAPIVGLSCIGQEQLVFTLLLGRWLKEHTDATVVVGGTIFSRIFERGVLPSHWFGLYFDMIIRNEGERPLEGLLANQAAGRPLHEGVPGVVHLTEAGLASVRPSVPLQTADIPVPDFSDLPLDRYFSPEITLPLLSARGCYWGKCEFCHHGMVYGERFQAYSMQRIMDTVSELAERYHVRHFAFNDEAIPPRVLREMGNRFPPAAESEWRFTGLIKFERSYTQEDFTRLRAVGFRSLYVGLESASERVLALMRKNNTKQTMLENLRYCRDADIWLHCFLFFGFPGETNADAEETYRFVLDNADIISSFGSARFVLEHNAPIYRHLEDFGLRIRTRTAQDIDVYYEFDADHEVGPAEAERWRQDLNEAALAIPKYTAVGWVPRELHLCLLSEMTIDELLTVGQHVRSAKGGVLPGTLLEEVIALIHPRPDGPACSVNLMNGNVLELRPSAAEVTRFCLDHGLTSADVDRLSDLLWSHLLGDGADLDIEAASLPVPAPL